MSKKAKFKWDNGDLLRDEVTGLEGIVMVRAEYSTGCHHYGLLPRTLNEKGEVKEWHWLDASRLLKVETSAVTFNIEKERTSGAFPSGPE